MARMVKTLGYDPNREKCSRKGAEAQRGKEGLRQRKEEPRMTRRARIGVHFMVLISEIRDIRDLVSENLRGQFSGTLANLRRGTSWTAQRI